MNAGYSGTPLLKKLGIKPGFTIKLVNAPHNYLQLLGPLPEAVIIRDINHPDPVDFLHFFILQPGEYEEFVNELVQHIKPDGMIWVSWDKTQAKKPHAANGNSIRSLTLPTGLVDIKVCAIDETWSGLKFMLRRELR